jgi:agmatine deiminase
MADDPQNILRMPAEWEKHEATWLSWPKNETTFPGKILEKVRETYSQMIKALSTGEKVNVLVDDVIEENEASRAIGTTENVFFYRLKTEDVWIRDYGPIFVRSAKDSRNASLKATKWIFNAWGGKYDDLLADNSSGMKVARLARLDVIEPGIVLEGGSIDVDGSGTILTTKQCLLNENRNRLPKESLEKYLKDYLGASKVIWLGEGIVGDDTDGHVDDVARFVSRSKVICMVDDGGANGFALKENYDTLCANSDAGENPLEVIPLPMPKNEVHDADGNPLPASYANFYIANSAVLVPIFGDENDKNALDTISSLFPKRETIGINCRALVSGFGAIHCVTQQQPEH